MTSSVFAVKSNYLDHWPIGCTVYVIHIFQALSSFLVLQAKWKAKQSLGMRLIKMGESLKTKQRYSRMKREGKFSIGFYCYPIIKSNLNNV